MTTGSTDKPKPRPRARKKSPEQWAEFISERAASLRAAGVLQVELEGASFVLAPPQPTEPEYAAPDAPDGYTEPADPFDDPHTYGLGGRVPAFPRERTEDND